MSSATTATIAVEKAALFEGDALWDTSWSEVAGEKTLKNRMSITNNNSGSSSDDADIVLYSSWFCPFAQRAWIAAEEAGTNFKWVEINPYYVDASQPGGYTKKAMTVTEKRSAYPDFIEASPRGLIPAIRHHNTRKNDGGSDDNNGRSRVIWDSLPVCEYIDAVFGGRKLMKGGPYEVARQQIWCSHVTDRVQKVYYQALCAQESADIHNKMEQFLEECRTLARAMSSSSSSDNDNDNDGGHYFNGNDFSMVDVAFAPFWQRILCVGPKCIPGFALPMDEPEFQRLDRWWKAVSIRPSVAATIVCESRLISSYFDYSINVATSDVARNYIK
mmetsp:Transcript_33697/g.34182  ORF Transcript_33697/g.34182 Transcript_33697/m.34182 type:complete len:331 (-) Transcript_33697:50-1042(-)